MIDPDDTAPSFLVWPDAEDEEMKKFRVRHNLRGIEGREFAESFRQMAINSGVPVVLKAMRE